MNQAARDWIRLTLPFDGQYQAALRQQHFAVQIIALAGHHLIPRQPDDSNTSMDYLSGRSMLVGQELSDHTRVALHLTHFEIHLLNRDDTPISRIPLDGKTWRQVFEEVKNHLTRAGMGVLRDEIHYEIPDHPVGNGVTFQIPDNRVLEETASYRHNSDTLLKGFAAPELRAEAIRVWPHHFDTGTLIPLQRSSSGAVTKSLGLGWAIPDSLVPEPYYYLSFWSQTADESLEHLPSLELGEWMFPEWHGAVLRHSEVLQSSTSNAQHRLVREFYRSGINLLAERSGMEIN
jgi:hypothetical protein